MFKIVIAEDEFLLQKALQKIIIGQTRYEISFTASNGKAALDYLLLHRADILITDIRMPVMDGLELVTKIKDSGIRIKTIVISGYNDFEYAKHMLKHGAFSYLLKPLVTEELLSTLAEASRTIQEEESKRNILKSHKFNALQQNGYVHFTDELPSVLLNSHRLFACCTDFKSSPAKTDIADFQFDLETRFYPCCCFMLDNYLYLVTSLEDPERDRIEIVTELQSYFTDRNISVKIGIGLAVLSMMEVYQSMKQARHALRFYKALPFDEFVDYERIPLLEVPAIPYPLTEEKNLLESVYSHSPDRIQQHITQFYTYLSGQDKDVIYQTLAELAVSCKREFSGYQLEYCDWDEIHFQIQHRQKWSGILYGIRKILLYIQLQLTESRRLANCSTAMTARKYIEDHMKEPLTLDEVANACFLSKSHFCKIFKEETGRTFKAYLNDIRIERAKDLLKNSTLKNYEIAQEIGIEDASYFNELFKKITGMTPVEFRAL